RGIALGGKFAGYEYPEGMNAFSKLSVDRLAGSGLIGVFNDPRHNGTPPGLSVAMIEIELDVETGKFEIKDLVSIADCGTVVHPQGLANQMYGGATWGVGLAGFERNLYDPQNGLPASTGYWQSKVPTILDVAPQTRVGWVDLPDPENPVGARGIGEPAQGCVAAALASAFYDATSGHMFNAAPVTADMIINHFAGTSESAKGLAQNNFRG
ncbi:MAG: molybdopterin cofactor-binding domain-containing protein, partial [Pseudohongiellaceae bacterium]